MIGNDKALFQPTYITAYFLGHLDGLGHPPDLKFFQFLPNSPSTSPVPSQDSVQLHGDRQGPPTVKVRGLEAVGDQHRYQPILRSLVSAL